MQWLDAPFQCKAVVLNGQTIQYMASLRVPTYLHCKEGLHWTDGAGGHSEGPSNQYIFTLGAPNGQHRSDGKAALPTQVQSCILTDRDNNSGNALCILGVLMALQIQLRAGD